jgi:hypothetical protein
MRYLARILMVAVVALGALTFVNDADAGHRRRGGCGCCDSVAVAEKPAPPAVADKSAPRTERSFSVEPSREYVPRYRSSRSSGGGYGLDYTQRQKTYGR